MHEHDTYMRLALDLARVARHEGEVPVGAVVVIDGAVAGTGRNASVGALDATAHAEVLAIREAGRATGNYRLVGATLYCTVEPCLMCLGAAVHARVERVVYGAPDLRTGGVAKLDALRAAGAEFNHRFDVLGGVLATEAADLIQAFFRERRIAGVGTPAALEVSGGEVPKWS